MPKKKPTSGYEVPKWVVSRKEALQTVGLRSFDSLGEAERFRDSFSRRDGVEYVIEETTQYVPEETTT